MNSSADIQRARLGVEETLSHRNRLEQVLAGCSDRQLDSMLRDISQRRERQTNRLLDWLQRPLARTEGASVPQSPEPPLSLMNADLQPASGPGDASAKGGAVSVIERRQLSSDLLVFKVSRPEGFSFQAGQSVKLGLGGVKRRYSVVSAPHESFLEFFVDLAPGGEMSRRLQSLALGDTLTLERPKGNLVLDEQFTNHLMVATVTGINPFISIIRDYLHRQRRGHRFFLLHGSSYLDEFGYQDELQSLAAAHPELLTYTPTVSRPDEPRNASWSGARGRVASLLESIMAGAEGPSGLDKRATLIYACGNPDMVNDVDQRYRSQGFSVKTERYG